MKKKLFRMLSALLAVVLMLTMTALAADTETIDSGTCGTNLKWSVNESGALTISGTGAMNDYCDDPAPWCDYNGLIKTVEIGSGTTGIGENAFAELTSLKTVTIAGSVKSIGAYAFAACSRLSSVTIGNGVVSIGEYAFCSCSGLESITIPDSVTTIGEGVFSNCSNMAEVTIGSNVASLGDFAFDHCSSLVSVTIPSSVTDLGEFTFDHCTSLTSVIIPNSVAVIGDGEFRGCSSLKRIEIPESMTIIGKSAFADCSSLTDVYYAGMEDQWDALGIGEGNDALVNAEVHYIYGHEHTWDAGKITTEATATTAGVKTYTCTVCGETKTEAIPATGSEDADEDSDEDIDEGDDEHGDTDISPFTDVQDSTEYYYKPVLWAVEKKITSGMTATTFAPDETCTRAQVVTFLYRAAGSPAVSGSNPFSDVKSTDYYYKAVLWAVNNHITTGMTQTTFAPNDTCTRAQVVTFLYRAAGSPTVGSNNPFGDVKSSDYYYKAVLWAVNKKVTSGTTNTTFSPENGCTRGQVVTFLYRYMA